MVHVSTGAADLAFKAEYALQFATDKAEGPTFGMQLPRQPYEQASFSINAAVADVLTVHTAARYTGFRFINRANTKYLGDYFLVDVSVRAILFKHLDIHASVKNIFNTPYIHLREYPVPGREFSAGIVLKY